MNVVLAISKLNEGGGLLPNTVEGWSILGLMCIFAVILLGWATNR